MTDIAGRERLKILKVETAAAGGIVRHDLAVSVQLVLVGHKAFQPNRASCVELPGADANFRSESITIPVSEAGRTVMVYTG